MNLKRSVKWFLISTIFLASLELLPHTFVNRSFSGSALLLVAAENDSTPTESEYVATTRQIRNLMKQISEQKDFSPEILDELEAALTRNRLFFQNARDLPKIRALLYASDTNEEHLSDHDLFNETYRALMANAGDNADVKSFTTILKMSNSLGSLVINNTEWSEHLEYYFEDLALAAPKALVLYFEDTSQTDFEYKLNNLWIFCELSEKKKELYDKLSDLDLKEQKHIRIIERIKKDLDAYCIGYWERMRKQ